MEISKLEEFFSNLNGGYILTNAKNVKYLTSFMYILKPFFLSTDGARKATKLVSAYSYCTVHFGTLCIKCFIVNIFFSYQINKI